MGTALVTGGAGFVGSHVVDALIERGDRVRVLDNLCTGSLNNLAHVRDRDRIEFVQGDVADAAVVGRAMKGVEVVFHQAALASVPRSIETPLETHRACATGTLVLLDEARKAGVKRVVYAASSSAYGDSKNPAKRETDTPRPISPYGAAKLAGEFYCQAFAASMGIESVCLRYFNVFGPRQDPGSPYSAVIPLFISAALAGRRPKIFGDGKQSRDFTYVANVVQANLLAASAPNVSGQVFNVAGGKATSLLELIVQLKKLLGSKVEPEFLPPRPGDIRESLADISKARRALGYEPQVDFESGLRLSIDYYRRMAERKGQGTVATRA
ncbi:MAG: SDR family oxidoreductase [Planctomycetia bacterium]|nr:SDR family oxidoreductase [Planctomycetia bacterium]